MPFVALTVILIGLVVAALAWVTATVAPRLLQLLRTGPPLPAAQSVLLGTTLLIELAILVLLGLVLLGLPTPWGPLY